MINKLHIRIKKVLYKATVSLTRSKAENFITSQLLQSVLIVMLMPFSSACFSQKEELGKITYPRPIGIMAFANRIGIVIKSADLRH